MANTKKTAAEAYETGRTDAAAKIERLTAALNYHRAKQARNPLSWGPAGDLERLNELLDQAIQSIGGA